MKFIKTNKYDKFVETFKYYLYFMFQFSFVLSGAAIINLNQSIYRYFTLLIIVPFVLLAILDIYSFLRGKFEITEIIIYALVSVFLLISFIKNRNVMVIANLILISIFKETNGKTAIKCYLKATISAFIIVVILGLIFKDLGNAVQYRGGVERTRYGVGFFYVSLGQFYYLSIVLAYILYKEKLKGFEYIILLVLDIILFYYTDTKAPFFYTILALLLVCIINNFKNTRIFDIFSIVTIVSPIVSCISMYVMSKSFDNNNEFLVFFNRVLNGRLRLTHNCIFDFGIKIFGQPEPKEIWDLSHYLDSSIMVLLIVFGIIVTTICIIFMSYFAYISYKTKSVAILISIFIIALRGTFDLGFMAVQFSPVVILFMPTLKKYLKKN